MTREKVQKDTKPSDNKAKQQQQRLDPIANQRRALAAQQQAQSSALQKQMADQQAAQRRKVARLRSQQSSNLSALQGKQRKKAAGLATAQAANVKRMAAAQAVKIGGIRSRGQAVSSSLNILADQQPTAPSAAVSPRRSRRGAASNAAQVARGSSRNRGPNLSI